MTPAELLLDSFDSILGDCLQHVGQASYVRGMHDRA